MQFPILKKIKSFFIALSPKGSHKRVVKLIELKHSVSFVMMISMLLVEIFVLSYVVKKLAPVTTSLEYDATIVELNINEAITDAYVEKIIKGLEVLNEEGELKHVLVVMQSGGGSPQASEELYQYFKELQSNDCHVYMYVSSIAASGAYYIANAVEYDASDTLSGIVANPNAIVGSIGVILPHIVFEEAAKTLGIQEQNIFVGSYKKPLSNFKQSTQEEQAYLKKNLLQPVYTTFLKRVSESRKINLDTLEKYADGRVFIASEVNGILVDKISSLYRFKKEIKQSIDIEDKGFVKLFKKEDETSLFKTNFNVSFDSPIKINNAKTAMF